MTKALELDHMLWRGFDDIALPELRALVLAGAPAERAAAGWALARWDYDQGDFAAAYRDIEIFLAYPEGRDVIAHAGPFLLAVELAIRCGDFAAAEALLAAIEIDFGDSADLACGRLMLAGRRGRGDAELSAILASIHAPRGLAPMSLSAGGGRRFDRLTAAAEAAVAAGTDQPLVSVIVPVFNAGQTLGRALDGLCRQDWPALEILVVDDASTDDSLAVAHAAAAVDPRIRIIAQTENGGAYVARNHGLALAEGSFVTVHDADDWSHPRKLGAQAEALLADPKLAASVSHWVRATSDLDMARWRMEDGWVYRNVSSLMIRAELRYLIGYWDRVRVNADTEYYLRILAAFGERAVGEVHPRLPLAFGRNEAGSLTQRKATHARTQFFGLRRDYVEAARVWHAHGRGYDDFYVARKPLVRPFRIPSAIGIGDPQGPKTKYDVVAGSPRFDARWYLEKYRDVLLAGVDPAQHYLAYGAREGRDPGPAFSTSGYRLARRLPPEAVPLLDWERRSDEARDRDALPTFPGALADAAGPRLLIFAHAADAAIGGAERSLLHTVARLGRQGGVPVVVLPTVGSPRYLDELRHLTAAVEILPHVWRHGSKAPAPELVEAMRALVRKHAAVAVHVNTLVLDAPLIAGRLEGCQTVVHVRELPAEDAALCALLGLSPDALRAKLLAETDRFIANSHKVERWLDAPGRVTIWPNMVDRALFDLPFEPHLPPAVAMISSNLAKKGIADFVALARAAHLLSSEVRFLLIGPITGDLMSLRPLPPNVECPGYFDSTADALMRVDVVVNLSRFAESFGRTVLEAMAAGRPVVCYDRGTPPDLVVSGRTGFVVPPDDIATATAAVLALTASRGGLMRMSEAARQRARQLQAEAEAAEKLHIGFPEPPS